MRLPTILAMRERPCRARPDPSPAMKKGTPMHSMLARGRIWAATLVVGLLTAIPVATASAASCPPDPNYAYANYSGLNLSMCNFVGFHFSSGNTFFTNTNLSQANFSGDNLSGVDFTGAILNRANLSGVEMAGATLTNAQFRGANLSNA